MQSLMIANGVRFLSHGSAYLWPLSPRRISLTGRILGSMPFDATQLGVREHGNLRARPAERVQDLGACEMACLFAIRE